MVPALTATAKTAASPRRRFGFVYVPHGAIMEQWTPTTAGAGFELMPILKPLEPFRDSLVVVSNLADRAAADTNHAVRSASLADRQPSPSGPTARTSGSARRSIRSSRSRSARTRRSRRSSGDRGLHGLVGACAPGYSCAYMNTSQLAAPTTPLPMEINPRVVFERMFGSGDTAEQRLARHEGRPEHPRFVTEDLNDLQTRLGAGDRVRLDEYLDHVREIERRIQRHEAQQRATEVAVPDAPVGVPESFEEHVGLMFDLLAVAYQADLTRVFTFMMARELSQRTYPELGVTEPHHAISHHGNNPEQIAAHAKVNTLSRRSCSRSSSSGCARRPTATARCSITR